jgi:hypothetical protein
VGNTAETTFKMMKERACLKCGVLHSRHHNAKYCESCSQVVKAESKKAPKAGPKTCEICLNKFDIGARRAARYCKACSVVQLAKTKRKGVDDYRARKGVKVGIGSGNNQGRGPKHHSYKTGIGAYTKIGKDLLGDNCERCGKELNKSLSYTWCTHHIDHDRSNNSIDNLELLCKSCHQKHHLSKSS